MNVVLALAFGLLFGAGLLISGMTDPAKVLGFLDIAGAWDASLAFVMGGAVIVAAPFFAWARQRDKALLGGALDARETTRIDTRLVLGAAVFGIGWGIAGLCPGPALVNLGLAPAAIWPFIAALALGLLTGRLADTTFRRSSSQ